MSAIQNYWPGAPKCELVVPGTKGHPSYIFKIKDRLKSEGFRYNGDIKLWYRPLAPEVVVPTGIAAFNLRGAIPKVGQA